MVAAQIVAGGMVPLAAAYMLGRCCLGRWGAERGAWLALAVGAVVESTLIFGLLAVGWVNVALPAVLGVIALLSLKDLRKPARPVFSPWMIIFGGYAALYITHALVAEIQPDGIGYHLGLVAEYARLGRFPDRIAFFEILPQGLEMLFLPAFLIGGHSAAKVVHLGFLLATAPALLSVARRLGLPDYAGATAAALYMCAPVVGVSGTSTYTDAAVVFFTIATFDLLLAWNMEGDDRCVAVAALLAGFCYAIKISAAVVPVLAFLWVLSRRRIRPALLLVTALIPILPWMIRALLLTGNPVAPLFNAWFPNPHFHPEMERGLAESLRGGISWRAPWELAVSGRLQGIFGPVYLLIPIGLLALRRKAGRWCWMAAALLALPWIGNSGARFLMPSAPFLALALAMILPKPAALAVSVLHAVICWPAVVALYAAPYSWKLEGFPLRAALRLDPESEYLKRIHWDYAIADMTREIVPPNEPLLSLLGAPRAYMDASVITWWQSTRAERMHDALSAAALEVAVPVYDLRAQWPIRVLRGMRFRLRQPHAAEWRVREVQLFSGEDRIHNSPQWLLDAWPNPWDAPLALDENTATRWRTREPAREGMFLEVALDRPQRISGVTLTSNLDLVTEVYGRDAPGRWFRLAGAMAVARRPPEDLRRAAVRYLKREGIRYILCATETTGPWRIGLQLAGQTLDWGLVEAQNRGYVHLFRIP